jgi:uncharacterized membrane protein YkoI
MPSALLRYRSNEMNAFTKIAIATGALGLSLGAYAGTQKARHETKAQEAAEHANAPKPKISEAQARAIAMTVAKGTIAESDYEKEGAGWRWSFDIRENGKIHEVGVDAMTGKIVENGLEAAGEAN